MVSPSPYIVLSVIEVSLFLLENVLANLYGFVKEPIDDELVSLTLGE